jgi:hypothetical protein
LFVLLPFFLLYFVIRFPLLIGFSWFSTVFALHHYFVSLTLELSFLQSCPLFSSVCQSLKMAADSGFSFISAPLTSPMGPLMCGLGFRARNIGPRRVRFRVTRYLSHILYMPAASCTTSNSPPQPVQQSCPPLSGAQKRGVNGLSVFDWIQMAVSWGLGIWFRFSWQLSRFLG